MLSPSVVLTWSSVRQQQRVVTSILFVVFGLDLITGIFTFARTGTMESSIVGDGLNLWIWSIAGSIFLFDVFRRILKDDTPQMEVSLPGLSAEPVDGISSKHEAAKTEKRFFVGALIVLIVWLVGWGLSSGLLFSPFV